MESNVNNFPDPRREELVKLLNNLEKRLHLEPGDTRSIAEALLSLTAYLSGELAIRAEQMKVEALRPGEHSVEHKIEWLKSLMVLVADLKNEYKIDSVIDKSNQFGRLANSNTIPDSCLIHLFLAKYQEDETLYPALQIGYSGNQRILLLWCDNLEAKTWMVKGDGTEDFVPAIRISHDISTGASNGQFHLIAVSGSDPWLPGCHFFEPFLKIFPQMKFQPEEALEAIFTDQEAEILLKIGKQFPSAAMGMPTSVISGAEPNAQAHFLEDKVHLLFDQNGSFRGVWGLTVDRLGKPVYGQIVFKSSDVKNWKTKADHFAESMFRLAEAGHQNFDRVTDFLVKKIIYNQNPTWEAEHLDKLKHLTDRPEIMIDRCFHLTRQYFDQPGLKDSANEISWILQQKSQKFHPIQPLFLYSVLCDQSGADERNAAHFILRTILPVYFGEHLKSTYETLLDKEGVSGFSLAIADENHNDGTSYTSLRKKMESDWGGTFFSQFSSALRSLENGTGMEKEDSIYSFLSLPPSDDPPLLGCLQFIHKNSPKAKVPEFKNCLSKHSEIPKKVCNAASLARFWIASPGYSSHAWVMKQPKN